MSNQGKQAPELIANPSQSLAKNVSSQPVQIATKQEVPVTNQVVNVPVQQTNYPTTQLVTFSTPQQLPYSIAQPLPYPNIAPPPYPAITPLHDPIVQQLGYQPALVYPPAQPAYAPSPPYQYQAPLSPIQQQPVMGMVALPLDFQEYLRNATTFHVKQQIELLEVLIGFETENRYTVKDQLGNIIFYVRERSECCARNCCGKNRAFVLNVKNVQGMDVLRFERGLDCSCFCGLILADHVRASRPSGEMVGSVLEMPSFIHPTYSIKDAFGNTRLKIRGPACPTALCCQDVVFNIYTPDGVQVGYISKRWTGFVQELFTDADFFSITFPLDLDTSIKATCLAALFMIDFNFFEADGDGEQGGRKLLG